MNTEKPRLKSGRRTHARLTTNIPVTLTYKEPSGNFSSVDGLVTSLHTAGLSCKFSNAIAPVSKVVHIELKANGNLLRRSGRVVWIASSQDQCGIVFDTPNPEWAEFVSSYPDLKKIIAGADRRVAERRSIEVNVAEERRKWERRYSGLLRELYDEKDEIEDVKVKTFLRSKATTYTPEVITQRREWLARQTKTTLQYIADFSEDAQDFKGKIENPIGVAHVPLGIAGPLKVNGEHARGIFFVPMAGTEGALITAYTLGSHIATRSGGINTKLLKDELRIGPIFVFQSLRESNIFVKWLESNFLKVKETAEQTSRHLRLTRLTHLIDGRRVIVNFHYHTADAMGMNMACKATEAACKFISDAVEPEEYWLRSNFNANKKVTANNFITGYGKTVTADVTIPRRLVGLLDTTPEEMERYFKQQLLASSHAVMIGNNGHFANAIAAMYIACGQDVALVANSHVGVTTCEVTKTGDTYFSVYLSNLLVGTVGGGTAFGTGRECLEILGCYGSDKVYKFAEIVAAMALAGEIAICAAIVNGTYVLAHETFGKNRPVK